MQPNLSQLRETFDRSLNSARCQIVIRNQAFSGTADTHALESVLHNNSIKAEDKFEVNLVGWWVGWTKTKPYCIMKHSQQVGWGAGIGGGEGKERGGGDNAAYVKHYPMTVKLRATAKPSHLYNFGHEPAGDMPHHETQPASGSGGGGGWVRGCGGGARGKKPLYETTANDHKADRTNPTCTSVLETHCIMKQPASVCVCGGGGEERGGGQWEWGQTKHTVWNTSQWPSSWQHKPQLYHLGHETGDIMHHETQLASGVRGAGGEVRGEQGRQSHTAWNTNNNNVHLSCAHQRPEHSHDIH